MSLSKRKKNKAPLKKIDKGRLPSHDGLAVFYGKKAEGNSGNLKIREKYIKRAGSILFFNKKECIRIILIFLLNLTKWERILVIIECLKKLFF